MRFGLAALVDVPMSAFAARAKLVERLGFDRLWVPDERLLRNVYVSLATAAASTSSIGLGTAVTNPYTRNPAITAAAIATIDELSGGRTVLGLGAGGGLNHYGVTRDSPAGHLADTIRIVRALTSGETVSYAGRFHELVDTQLDFPPQRPVPIHVAARGPAILRVAGRLADGVIIGGFASPAGLRWALAAADDGLRAAGRSLDELHRTAWVFISLSERRDAARTAVGKMVLAAMVSSGPTLEEIGVTLPQEVRTHLDTTGWAFPAEADTISELLTDDIVDMFAVHGDAAACADRLQAITESDVDEIGLVILPPAGDTVEDVAIRLAETVLPRVAG